MTYSLPPEAYRTLRPEPARRGVRVWDVTLTVVLLVLLPLVAVGASYFGLFLAMASDACGSVACNTDLINFGLWFAVLAPWGVLLIGVTASIVLLVRHHVAFWVPLAAVAAIVALWFVAAAIVGAGVSAS